MKLQIGDILHYRHLIDDDDDDITNSATVSGVVTDICHDDKVCVQWDDGDVTFEERDTESPDASYVKRLAPGKIKVISRRRRNGTKNNTKTS